MEITRIVYGMEITDYAQQKYVYCIATKSITLNLAKIRKETLIFQMIITYRYCKYNIIIDLYFNLFILSSCS